MTKIGRNKLGRFSENKSRSRENHERGRGARRIGNPRYKPVVRKGRKVYVLRDKPKK